MPVSSWAEVLDDRELDRQVFSGTGTAPWWSQ
jgi:hypothetical protein